MALYIGTSGWAYKEWKPDFYPAETKQKQFLEHYATRLSACEINATFYRLQKPETFARWVAEVPPGFRFAIKAHRRLTHGKTIAPDDDQGAFLKAFLSSLEPLGDRLGALLFQFPAYRKKDMAALESLMERLPMGRCAFEFRSDTWSDEDVTRAVSSRGGTICIADTTGDAPPSLPGGEIAYIRLRHDQYTDAQRAAWLSLVRSESQHRDVFVFSKHEGVAAGDPHAGVGLAVWLTYAQ